MKIQIKIIASLLLLMLNFLPIVHGQHPYFREVVNSNNFNNVRFNCIYQDQTGFIWIGTNNGLYQFDGLSFHLVTDDVEQPTLNISSISEDSFGKIWFGYDNGFISSYNPDKSSIDFPEGKKPKTKITCIQQFQDSTLIFGTYGEGLFILKNNKFEIISTEKGLSDDYIYTIVIDDNNRIWIGTDNGISICNFSNDSLNISYLSVKEGLPDFIVQSLEKDSKGRIWIGTYDYGVCAYDLEKDQFLYPLSKEKWRFGPVKDILTFQNRIWIATENKGVIDYNILNNDLNNYQVYNNINLERINSLMQDKEGNIWLTSNMSISQSFGPKLEYLSSIGNVPIDNIHAVASDRNDFIWFSNDKGLYRYKPDLPERSIRLKKFALDFDLEKHKITCFHEDPYGLIWIGTFGKGIIRLNPETGQQFQITEKNSRINGNVLSIKGTDNEIWFATLGGAFKCKIDSKLVRLEAIPEFENFQQNEGLSNNFIYHIYIDGDQRVWFATDGSGVAYYENGQIYTLPEDDLKDKVVYSITGDNLGNIWMNVAGEGIYKYDGHQVLKFYQDPDHKSFSFTGIQSNNANEVIIAFGGGIDVLPGPSDGVIHYEENAGLAGINPDLNTLTSDSKGTVWIGTSKGLIRYTASGSQYWNKPVSVIKSVAVYLEQIDANESAIFSFKENHFSFDYTGLWFQYPEKVDYLIQLEGHDLDWVKTNNKNVSYSNLEPGKYTFKIQSTLGKDFKNASVANYTFSISSPFWKTFWFYFLVVVGLGVLIYFYIKYRENRIRIKQEAIQEKIKFQFENLKSQINPHFLFNSFSTLIALIESAQDEAIEYVEELSTLFRNILEFKDQELISLKEEMSIIDNYYKLQRKRYGENLVLNINEETRQDSKKIPPMTIQMLIENSLKHNIISKDKPLEISIFLNKEHTLIYIKNNLQIKQENIQSTGIGIQNIINRYKLLTHREIEITKTHDIFMVGLPVIN